MCEIGFPERERERERERRGTFYCNPLQREDLQSIVYRAVIARHKIMIVEC